MTPLPISELRKALADVANRVAVAGERVIVERHGKNIFAVVPIEDVEVLERLEDAIDLDAIRNRADEPAVSLARVKKALGL